MADVNELLRKLKAQKMGFLERRDVVRALGELGDRQAVEPLLGCLADKERLVRREAAAALGKLSDARAVEPLIAALGDEDYEVRKNAAAALGELGDARAIEPLREALEDMLISVRDAAKEGIEKIEARHAAAGEHDTGETPQAAAEALIVEAEPERVAEEVEVHRSLTQEQPAPAATPDHLVGETLGELTILREFDCPQCGKQLSVFEEQVGQSISCPSCDAEIVVPGTAGQVGPAPEGLPAAPATRDLLRAQNDDSDPKRIHRGQPLQRPSGPPAGVPTYLVPAILSTLFCCLPFGIVAIVYAAQVGSKAQAGDIEGARGASQRARTWCWVAFGLGLAWIAICVLTALAQ